MTKTTSLLLMSCALLQACGGNDGTPADQAPAVTIETVRPPVESTPEALAAMFQTLDGQPLELSAYAGKKIFLNYWATWCAPCIREIPAISRAAAELAPENYVFLLASDESLDKINDFLLEREFTGNFIKLNGFFGSHGIAAVPSSALYDESGALVRTWAGAFEWDSPEMLAQIRAAEGQ